MICFGIKTDQEVKEKGSCGSHLKKQTKKNREKRDKVFFLVYIFSSLTSLFDIRKSDH